MESDDLAITLSVEEEFFLINLATHALVTDPEPDLLAAFQNSELADVCQVVPEVFRSQIKTNSRVCRSVAEVREALATARGKVLEVADRHGVGIIGSSSHPFASWEDQIVTPRDRYRDFAMTYQSSIRQMLVGGMHIHAGFGTADERVQVLTALRRFLPVFLALSGSSPFTFGHMTGYKSSRVNVMAPLPISGLPPAFATWAEFDQMVENYRDLQFIEDGTELWWDIRPSLHSPTLELQICDVCPDVNDALCMVTLYACLVRHLLARVRAGTVPPEPPQGILLHNRWLASRYGTVAFFADFENRTRVDLVDHVDELLDMIAADTTALNCRREVEHARKIIREGASADRQLDLFRLRRLEGERVNGALRSVVGLIAEETRRGVAGPAPKAPLVLGRQWH